MKLLTKLALVGVTIAASVPAMPSATLAAPAYYVVEDPVYVNSRMSRLDYDDGVNMYLKPTWAKDRIHVFADFKIKNKSKRTSQKVYITSSRFYAYRDGAVYYSIAPSSSKELSDQIKEFTLKPGKSKRIMMTYSRAAKGFDYTKAEYYCTSIMVKEGKGKAHSVGVCADNRNFK